MDKLQKRRLLYTVFFLIFFTIGPVLALYATGYLYNFKKNRLEKTGILLVESIPPKAAVYLDGSFQKTTPARIARLFPQKYNLLITKDGYHSWLKEIEIKSNLTTFYKDVILFKKTAPILKIAGQINIFEILKEKNIIIYSILKNGSEELKIFDLGAKTDNVVATFSKKNYDQINLVKFTPNEEKVILKQKIGNFNKYLIIEIASQKINDLTELTKLNFDQIHWDTKNANNLYGLRKNVLYKINPYDHSVRSVLTANMLDFQVLDETITYTSKEKDGAYINQFNPNETEAKKIKLPNYSNYSFLESPAGFIALLDKKSNNLTVLRPEVFATKNIEDQIIFEANAENIAWSKDNQKIVYYDNFEIGTYNFTTKQNELISRYSTAITNIFWHPESNYIFFETENKIKATEANTSEQKNSLILAQAENIRKIQPDAAGDIYFVGQIEKTPGIYQLIIN